MYSLPLHVTGQWYFSLCTKRSLYCLSGLVLGHLSVSVICKISDLLPPGHCLMPATGSQ